MKTRVSKAYRGNAHIGFKKTVAGREWFLIYGTSPAREATAIAIATALEAKWKLIKLSGRSSLSDTDFNEASDLALGHAARRDLGLPELSRPEPAGAKPFSTKYADGVDAPAGFVGRRWLHASIDEFVATIMRNLKPDGSNGDDILNTRDRILRAREAIEEIPLDLVRRKELDDWLSALGSTLRSKFTGEPLGAVYIRNLAQAVRAAMTKFAEWEWWTPPALSEKAFKAERLTVNVNEVSPLPSDLLTSLMVRLAERLRREHAEAS